MTDSHDRGLIHGLFPGHEAFGHRYETLGILSSEIVANTVSSNKQHFEEEAISQKGEWS